MKRYTADIADMKVALYCSGLEAQVKKLSVSFLESNDTDDADVAVIFAANADKTVRRLLDGMESEGTTATLTVLLVAETPTASWRVVDFCVVAKENQLTNALSDVLSMLDYYTYCQPVDVGELLQRRGRTIYQPLGQSENPTELAKTVKMHLAGASKALLFLNVGKDVWDSDVMLLCEALSQATGQTALSVAPIRTLEESRLSASLFVG